jgi:hypothetical protein
MRARFYSPYLMRFLNPDPIGFSGGMNWFAYANGDPLMQMDPLGLWSTTQTWGVVKGVGGLVEAVVGYGFAAGTAVTGVGIAGGVIVGTHGVDTMQAGFRQAWGGQQVDTGTSQAIQMTGVSRNTANLIDAGIGVVGSAGTGIATATSKIAAASVTVPEIAGMSKIRTMNLWESGSRALPTTVYNALGGSTTHAVQKGLMIEQGFVTSAQMGNVFSNLGTAVSLAKTGLTPWGNVASGAAGSVMIGGSYLGTRK